MQLKYPFLNGISIPNDKKSDIKAIRNWLKHQPYLPELTDEHIVLFLHSNYYSLERTKDTIESYYILRAENIDFFDWDLDDLAPMYDDFLEFASIEQKTDKNYKVLIYRLKDYDPSHLNVAKTIKSFLCWNDVHLSENGLADGFIVVLDMKGTTFTHLAKVSATFNLLRVLMIYIQDCHPCRLKGVHIVNSFSLADKILALIKPLLHTELLQILFFHSDLKSFHQIVKPDLLPIEYGGSNSTMKEIHDEGIKLMRDKYSKWIKDIKNQVADLKKRPTKAKTFQIMEGSFRSLSID